MHANMKNRPTNDLEHILEHTHSLWEEGRGNRCYHWWNWFLEFLFLAGPQSFLLTSFDAVYGKQLPEIRYILGNVCGGSRCRESGINVWWRKRDS